MSTLTHAQIPSFPPSPPESPLGHFHSPDWFRPTGKALPSLSGHINLGTPPLTPPPLSPISSGSTSSSDDGDVDEPPRRPRLPYQKHRRVSAPTYFSDASTLPDLPKKPTHQHRARFPSMPVTGMITPMWSIDEEDASREESTVDPFKLLLPFCQASTMSMEACSLLT